MNNQKGFDDDGRYKRTGNVWTSSARIIAAVIGPVVLCLPWAIAQLGWVIGPLFMILFAMVTYYTSFLLSACYRSGDPVIGERNYTFIHAVHSYLGGIKAKLCGLVQYADFFGVCISCTVQSSKSIRAIKMFSYTHKNGGRDSCHANNYIYTIIFGATQIVLSQVPKLGESCWLSLSIAATLMSFTYSTIGLGLSIGKVIDNGAVKGSLTGVRVGVLTPVQKVWRTFQALGDIAFSYSYSTILIEIQDKVKFSPPESETMNKASFISVLSTSIFFMLCGCFGYAALGDSIPENLLSDFGFYNPYWLLEMANVALVIHLAGSYQIYSQPIFICVERQAAKWFPNSCFFREAIEVSNPFSGEQPYILNMFKLVWRTLFVVITSMIAMFIPSFNHIVGLVGAIGYWPLSVYFPVEMYIVQNSIPKWTTKWISLKVLSLALLIISIAAAIGSIAGIVGDVPTHLPFSHCPPE